MVWPPLERRFGHIRTLIIATITTVACIALPLSIAASWHPLCAQVPPVRLPPVVIKSMPDLPGARTIAGVARDTIGYPVPGVELSIGTVRRRVFSDANGNFRFGDIAKGTYEIRARKVGYAPQVRSIIVDSAGGVGAFALVPIPYALLPVVSSAARGGVSGVVGDTAFRPLVGAEVHLSGHGASTRTDSMGAFFLPVDAGSYIVNITRPGYAYKIVSVVVPADSGRRITAYLSPLARAPVVREANNLVDFSQRLAWRDNQSSKIYTRAELRELGIEWATDAVQMAFTGAFGGRARSVLDKDCAAIKNGGPGIIELAPLTVDDIEVLEVYPSPRDPNGAGRAGANALRASIPRATKSNTNEAVWANRTKTCALVYVWLR